MKTYLKTCFTKIVISGFFFFISSLVYPQFNYEPTLVTRFYEMQDKNEKKDKKKKNEFKVFAGLNFSMLDTETAQYNSKNGVGYLLGGAYKQGRFFYWEIGARYNNPVYSLQSNLNPFDTTRNFIGVRTIDVPITGGINFLSFISRIVGLRAYVSAVPTFIMGIGDNDLGLTADDLNSFVFQAQAGIGVDIAFLFIESGYLYGFGDVFTNDVQSIPNQIFINLGFRF